MGGKVIFMPLFYKRAAGRMLQLRPWRTARGRARVPKPGRLADLPAIHRRVHAAGGPARTNNHGSSIPGAFHFYSSPATSVPPAKD